MWTIAILFLLIWASSGVYAEELNRNSFPEDFMFGVSTSAYQIEGAWNESGKGENAWDRFTHHYPERIVDGSNADVACGSYHKFQEDVSFMKDLGVQFYRFSLSWSRILPKGVSYKINPDGIRYYNELIDLLIENDIIPMITLYHWDTPQSLEDLRGVANPRFPEWFEEYARVAFENFGEKVKFWLTFNDPTTLCREIYSTDILTGIIDYICGHHVLKAHARVYHMYNQIYKPTQKGKISIGVEVSWYQSATYFPADIKAAERMMDFTSGWITDPIYSEDGDYPQIMKELIAKRSKIEGFWQSRLPEFTKIEIEYIKGSYDYIGINHYDINLVAGTEEAPAEDPSLQKDIKVVTSADTNWPASNISPSKVAPWALIEVLKWIKDRYGNIPIFIVENGFGDCGEIDDQDRISYLKLYLSALLDAIYKHEVNVKGYAVWSLLDNFEWMYGYSKKYGLYHVDFSDSNRTRAPKSSVSFYKNVIAKRNLIIN